LFPIDLVERLRQNPGGIAAGTTLAARAIIWALIKVTAHYLQNLFCEMR
jgi:hypothetical protein